MEPDPVLAQPSEQKPSVPSSPAPQSEAIVSNPPKKRYRLLKWLLIGFMTIILIIGTALWWLFYYRHFNFGHRGGDLGVLKAGIFEGTMNHFAPTMESDDATVYINRQIFEGLVIFENQTKIVPNLVTGWTNPDDKTWLFTLKPNVKFHNGDILSAKDVVYSYEQLKNNQNFSYVTETIANVEAVSNDKVKFITKSVDPILLNRLVDMFIIDADANGKSDPQYGAGPYLVKPGTTPTSSHIELAAFDGYHGGHVRTKGVQVTVYNEDDQQAVTKAFILGKLNLVAFVPSSVVATAKSLNFQAGSRDDPSVYQLAFNTNKSNSPVAKLAVRQAIYKTIDVTALLKALDRDQTGKIANQILSASIPGYNPDIIRPAHDTEGAKTLLKQAGYSNGVDITLTVFSAAKDAGEEMVRQLAEVGIRVKLDIRTDVAEIQNDVAGGKLEAFYYAEGSSLLDGSDAFSKLLHGANYHNPSIDQKLAEANGTLDQVKRLNALKQVSLLAANDVSVIPLYTNKNQWIMDRAYIMPEDTLVNGLGVYLWKVHL